MGYELLRKVAFPFGGALKREMEVSRQCVRLEGGKRIEVGQKNIDSRITR